MSSLKQKIQKSIRSHTLLTDVFGYGLIKLGFADTYLAGLVTMYHSYYRLAKKFGQLADKLAEADQSRHTQAMEKPESSRRVWVCWFQGMNQAPQIVQDSYSSIQYWLKDWEITVITADTYMQYANIPDYIVDKWKQGIFSDAHFSDILRLDLLVQHGGLWLDATTFLSGPLPEYILGSDFFVYRNGWMDQEMINMGSWLIYSPYADNTLLRETEQLLFEYWRSNNYLLNYFLMHMFFRMVTDRNREQWDRVPYVNQVDNHLLQWELERPFDSVRVKTITDQTSVHKLTYKLESGLASECTCFHLQELMK